MTLLVAAAFAVSVRSTRVRALRAAGVLGLLALGPLFLLGAMWPSAFTFVALLALPAGFILLVAIARPSLLRGFKTRTYSLVAVFLSPASLLVETLRLVR